MKFKTGVCTAALLLAGIARGQEPTWTPAPGGETVEFDIAQAQGGTVERGVRIQRVPGQPDVVKYTAARVMGPWWKNSEIVNELHLTDQQKKDIEQSFLQYRLQLIDANAAVQKLDTRLDALMNAEYLEEGEINQVLDQLVQARGQLSKMYAGMLIAIRKELLPEQWKKLQTLQAEKGVMPMMFGAGPVMLHEPLPGGPGTFIRRLPSPPPPTGAPPNQP